MKLSRSIPFSYSGCEISSFVVRYRRWIVNILVIIVNFLATVFLMACAAPPAKPVTLIFERSGGFAGLSDRLEINLTTGMTRLEQGTTVITTTISSAQRSSLQTLISGLDLASLAAMPSPPNQCCDLITYRIQIDTTIIHATDADLPVTLQPLVSALNAMIAEISSSS